MTNDELRMSNDALTNQVAGLRQDMREFFESFDQYKKDNDTRAGRFVLAIVLLGVLLAMVGTIAIGNWRNSDRIERLTQIGVCPSNAFQLGSYDPSTRRPEDRDAYERSIAQLRQAREVLGCQDYELTPPRVDK